MYFTTDSMLPENQQPLLITVAPFGPQRLEDNYPEDIAVSRKDQVQKAVDCYNAGATVLHIEAGNPKTDDMSKSFAEYCDFIGMLRKAVPKMILQIGSISLAPEPGTESRRHGHDTRHVLTELDPKPDQVTVALGNTLTNSLALSTSDSAPFANPVIHDADQDIAAASSSASYTEHLKRLRARAIQPYFSNAELHHLDELEHLIRAGVYMGPVNHVLTATSGPGFSGRNPIDFIEYVRRSPPGSVMTMESISQTVAPFAAMAIAFGVHVRCGSDDSMPSGKSERRSSIQQVDQIVRLAKELKRPVATADQAREMFKLGVWYNSVEETLDALWAYRPVERNATSVSSSKARMKN